MKYLNILSAGLLLLATACEKDIPKFSAPECLLNFYYGQDVTTEAVTDAMRAGSYSFRLNASEDQTIDTFWVEVRTMGTLSSENRPVQLEQIMLGGDTLNAEAGVHYVPFNAPEIMALSYVPANATSCSACGGNNYYCPGGTFNVSSSAQGRNTVSSGYYSTGGTSSTTRTGQSQCIGATYCTNGKI